MRLVYNKARQASITNEIKRNRRPARQRFNERGTVMSAGKIVQIIGAVIDVEFPQDAVPKVYDALKVESGLTLEVQQQLGGGVVRCIALGTSDG